MTRRALSRFARSAQKVRQRLRRRVARAAIADLQDELDETRRRLKTTRRRLKETTAQLHEARRQLGDGAYTLPEEVEATIAQVRGEHLTYLKAEHLRDLAAAVRELDAGGTEGLVIEAGTARGGSAIVLAAAKRPERPMKVYDVFGMIPPPTEQDGPDVHARYAKITAGEAKGVGGDTYYGYRDDLYDEVTQSFARLGVPVSEHGVELIRGLFEDTIQLDEPVALAHLDGDWYESTMTCLTRIVPLLVPGGRIVLDDYFAWSGCRVAVDEYFDGRDGFRFERGAKLHVVRA